ncbi:MFS transporter [Streptomyces sp. NPDC007084]|uniref:MFS transporter n=1 Tax=Streptomyces sp. NPDC007084 TaxID=3154313 RepID=UPI003451868F
MVVTRQTRGPLARYLAVAVPIRLAAEGARVALILLAAERTGAVTFGGLLTAVLLVPSVVAAPVMGALADRVRRKKPFFSGVLACYAVCLAAVAVLTGRAPDAVTLAVALPAGCCGPLVTGGLTSLLPVMLPAEALPRAFSFDSTSYNVAGIVGPSVAAVLTEVAGAGWATVCLAGCALAAAVTLSAGLPLPSRSPVRPPAGEASVLGGVLEIVRNPPLSGVTWASCIGQAGVGALPIITALVAAERGSTWAAGGLMTVYACGSLVGSASYALRPWSVERPERVVVGCVVLAALPLALSTLLDGLWPVAALFACGGWCTGPLFSALLAAREKYTPAGLRTQVFTVGAGLKSAFAAGGAALAGVFHTLGSARLLWAVAATLVLASVTGTLRMRRAGPRGCGCEGVPDRSGRSSSSARAAG